MTKTPIYCYERNGGSCRNKVSLANNFICSAGHRGAEQGSSVLSGSPVVALAIDLSRMSTKKKLKLARDPSTSPEFLDELAMDKEWYVRRAVGSNSSTWPETLAKLAMDKEWYVQHEIARNTSTPPETQVLLAKQGHIPLGFVKGKPIDDLIKDISLVDQYSDTFGLAYLHRLTYYSTSEDASRPKRRALIGYAYGKYAESDRTDSYSKQHYKEHIKALFPDDQEMAEMIGY